MLDVLLDTVLDSVRLLPFLFLTYLFMEALEHHTGSKLSRKIQSAGKWGPVWGGLLGVIPQCGFSAAASSLFAGNHCCAVRSDCGTGICETLEETGEGDGHSCRV